MLHIAGFFASVPSQVNFELIFAPVESQWRLFGISVSIGQSAPAAPEAPSAPAAKAPPTGDKPGAILHDETQKAAASLKASNTLVFQAWLE